MNTLALVDDVLYAGGTGNGVWMKQLETTNDWMPVTAGTGWNPNFSVLDLVYQSSLCGGGLFAATDNGAWIYETH